MKVEVNNQDTINNLNFSPLNLFYSFYKDTINITENKFATEKIKVNLYGSSYEYFFSIEVIKSALISSSAVSVNVS